MSTFTNLDLFEKEIQKAIDVEMFIGTMFCIIYRTLTFENSPLIGLSQVITVYMDLQCKQISFIFPRLPLIADSYKILGLL